MVENPRSKMKGKKDKSKFDKYVRLAKSLKAVDAEMISPKDIFFDIRAILKCQWGCDRNFQSNIRCGTIDINYQERIEMIRSYSNILLIHSHDVRELSVAVLKIERAAFLDGYYFAFAIRACNLCRTCRVQQGDACPRPHRVRPCESSFGINVYKTARNLGLPCEVLQNKNDIQNRYGFVLID